MTNIVRMAPGMPVAAAITIFLFLGMMTLINVEYRPEPAIPDYVIDIFPVVDPYEPVIRNPTVSPVEPVEPPPPVRLDIDRASVDPAGPPVELGRLPDISPPVVEAGGMYLPTDREETPIVRVDPAYPDILLSRGVEGSCVVTYDIAANGTTFNVRASCSNSGFVRNSERAVERWRFNPRRENGQDVIRRNRQTTLTFALTD